MKNDRVKLQNKDGSTTEINIYSGIKQNAVAVVLPAMGVYAKYYKILAEELATNGLVAVLADLRGNDTSSVRPKRSIDFGYSEILHLDIDTIVSHVNEQFSGKPIYLFGHSLGGQLGCLYASKNPFKVAGLILSATCSVYYRGWEGFSAYRILAGTQFANAVAKMFGYFPGKKVGFGGMEARTVIKDWSNQSRTGIYNLKNDDFNYEKALSELNIPVLAISYQGDGLCPKGAVEHLLDKMESATVDHIHLEKSDPRNEGFNHFNWAKKPRNIVEIINGWSGLKE